MLPGAHDRNGRQRGCTKSNRNKDAVSRRVGGHGILCRRPCEDREQNHNRERVADAAVGNAAHENEQEENGCNQDRGLRCSPSGRKAAGTIEPQPQQDQDHRADGQPEGKDPWEEVRGTSVETGMTEGKNRVGTSFESRPYGIGEAPDIGARRHMIAGHCREHQTIGRRAKIGDLGRDFLPSDAYSGAAPVVMIGYTVWRNRYASSPSVIGRQVRINEKPATIVGVMPRGFMFPTTVDLWMPLVPTPNDLKRDNRQFQAFALLRPGIRLSATQAELSGNRKTPRLWDSSPSLHAPMSPT